MPDHASIPTGALKRNTPIGALPYGMPRNALYSRLSSRVCSNVPRTPPNLVCTIGELSTTAGLTSTEQLKKYSTNADHDKRSQFILEAMKDTKTLRRSSREFDLTILERNRNSDRWPIARDVDYAFRLKLSTPYLWAEKTKLALVYISSTFHNMNPMRYAFEWCWRMEFQEREMFWKSFHWNKYYGSISTIDAILMHNW